MSNLWWLQPGWTDTLCGCCGQKIYPEGDPDWGLCHSCFTEQMDRQAHEDEQRHLEEQAMEEHFQRYPHG